MIKYTSILFAFLLFSSFIGVNSIQCGDNQIENCKQCGEEEESDTCKICQDHYFPLLENLICGACNDPIYSQTGCKTECVSILNHCEDCKEGYDNSNGLCIEPDCKKHINNCKKCHFEGEGFSNPKCNECLEGYFLDSSNDCSICSYKTINGANCYVCSSDSKQYDCSCEKGYTLFENSCKQCSLNCDLCEYKKESDSTKCLKCSQNYFLNSQNNCELCTNGCPYCELDKNNNQKCIACQSYRTLTDDNKCLGCPNGCSECMYDNVKKKMICITCSSNYVLDPEIKECKQCSEISEIGQGCNKCIYNPDSKKYECKECSYYYCYVNNTFQCFSNTDNNKPGLYGCEFAEYNKNTDKYECLKCKSTFIHIITDKTCSSSTGLTNCLVAERKENDYSCVQCKDNYALVENTSTKKRNCQSRSGNLIYCLEGKNENGQNICTKCVNNSLINDNKCSCNSDSISNDNYFCYKCNDENHGILGCNEISGCNYTSSNRVNCNQCKDGFYKNTQGKCLLCSTAFPNCGNCYYNNTNYNVVCQKCIDSIYTLNKTINKCQLNDCDEYPEISPGCIICQNKIEEYKDKKICQACKYGYFKTKDQKCEYCNSEKNGGPACNECGYEKNDKGIETNKIICKECHSILTKDGKCYDCQIQFSNACKECQLIKNENGIETLKCISCSNGYYLTPEGNCIYILSLIPRVPNCLTKLFSSENMQFKVSSIISLGIEINYRIDDYSNYDTVSNLIYSTGLKGFESKCLTCDLDYILNDDGKCEEINYEKCSFNSIMKKYNKLYGACKTFCNKNNNVKITFAKKIEGKLYKLSIDNFEYYNYNNFIEYFKDSDKIKACLNNLGIKNDYSPDNLKYCKDAYYFPDNNSYVCINCYSSEYTLDDITHLCTEKSSVSCNIQNIGTEKNPEYNCVEENKRVFPYTLVTYDNEKKEKDYIKSTGPLLNCIEATANTEYLENKYDCTRCSSMYIPFYSKFYERIICQDLKSGIIKENSGYHYYDPGSNDKTKAVDGVCEKDYLFTPDEENCYKCDDISVGIQGCKSGCTFSKKRNKIFKCEGQCKKGYIEVSEGICSKCNDVNMGCHECKYENEDKYENDYKGIKRKRKFVCEYCEEGYMKSSSGECVSCSSLGLDNCNQCKVGSDNNYICEKCQVDYFINDKGKCETCDELHFKGLGKNQCFNCDNTSEGGIDKCYICDLKDEKVNCKGCLPGFILSIDENSCLEIAKNKELENFVKCEQLSKVNDKYECSKCKEEYTLVRKNNINECIYIRSLYDNNFSDNYKKHFYFINENQVTDTDYTSFRNNDNFIYNRYIKYAPCQEAKNLGNEENPLYSCTKCYEDFNTNNPIIKITELNSKLSYCVYSSYLHSYLNNPENCTEATHKTKDGNDQYNCTKCIKNNDLIYNNYNNPSICLFSYATIKCLVINCEECDPYDGYICKKCRTDYEINNATGSCVKQTSIIPEIIWKSIYNLNMLGSKALHDKMNAGTTKYIYGPSFSLRGITSNQINSGHGFFIYLTFKRKNRIRNLEEEEEKVEKEEGKEEKMEDYEEEGNLIKIPGICEVLEEVEEIQDDMNLVDYKCIGNQTKKIDFNNYKLVNIEEGDNEQLLKKSNLEELVSNYKNIYEDLKKLENVEKPLFTLEDLVKIVIF